MTTERFVTDYVIPGKAPVTVTPIEFGGFSVTIEPWYEAWEETAEAADDHAVKLARVEYCPVRTND